MAYTPAETVAPRKMSRSSERSSVSDWLALRRTADALRCDADGDCGPAVLGRPAGALFLPALASALNVGRYGADCGLDAIRQPRHPAG